MVVNFDLGDGIERSDPALRAYRSRLARLGNTSKFEGVGSDVERVKCYRHLIDKRDRPWDRRGARRGRCSCDDEWP